MNATTSSQFSAFAGDRLLASGSLAEVAIAVKMASGTASTAPVLIFDDASGRAIDLDLRGSHRDIVARLPPPVQPAAPTAPEARGRGRPKLGVVAREVTLLPRHWDWLNARPGGASVALRKLVDDARRATADADRMRAARDAAYHFMSAMAGDRPGFEEASRALFAGNVARLQDLTAAWPTDIRSHLLRLLSAVDPGESNS
ncbi:DUF2239 family protein [Tardiphaga sp. vice352]|uniref:DUF2239 family protein n=1 Tax=unclassified Tardiphaga TaxID=2631404 RepID=UPI001163BD80|nr:MULTISPECIES: DUF2239 family protein [unclassified Tardiphaga]QDM14816.1 DUF2239 family protein [Tardiphaga sp. vice278]QDM19923.1 DUF2239 family protein [Tardiphaga sp. vice154]QDM24997.1 DUF2239 family protein [Tardiphaga sp. vice304]QDM30207.1 DUF2239 family protein [Tardiphaga sp. vice352]